MKSTNSITENRKATFTKQSRTLIQKIASQIQSLNAAQGGVRNSIVAVGRTLESLQTLAKKNHQSFADVVEDAPINLPRSTAYHYIKCFQKASKLSARTFALATAAGLDPAQPRMLRYLTTHNTSGWTATKLASKTAKTHGRGMTARAFFNRALVTYVRKLREQGSSFAEVRATILPMVTASWSKMRVAKTAKAA
jgi:hypothetical protein